MPPMHSMHDDEQLTAWFRILLFWQFLSHFTQRLAPTRLQSRNVCQVSSIEDDLGAPVPVAAGAEHRTCLRRAGRATARGLSSREKILGMNNYFCFRFDSRIFSQWLVTMQLARAKCKRTGSVSSATSRSNQCTRCSSLASR